MHLALDLDVPPSFSHPMDVYISLGSAFASVPSGFFTTAPLGFATFEGINYFLSDSPAVFVEYV